MSATNDSPDEWSHIEPLLDEAVDSLEEPDRTAILLRYFENKSLQEVGAALGASEDAAQKRVSRAVEQLREFFSKRKVAIGAVALTALLSANAIQAVPTALSTIVVSGAVASSALSTVTTKIAIAMTTTQKIIIAGLLGAALAGGAYEGIQASRLRQQVQTLQQQQQQTDAMKRERDQANAKLAQVTEENAALKSRPTDVLKLRGQVGQLKREKADLGSKSALSKMTANPEARKMMREQQKMGMAIFYMDFAKQANLTPDVKGKLNDLLADHVMTDVDNITTALRDTPAKEQMAQTFAAEDAALQQQVSALLGADGLAQFNDYTKNLAATLTADQFKDELTGTDAEKTAKAQQLTQLMQTEMASARANANLPADYQVIPILNLPNIASQEQGDQSINLLQGIYQNVTAQSSSFLSPDEVTAFKKFTTTAVNNNRMALTMNRSLMAPIEQ